MDSIATAAVKSGGKRTRGLLLEPPDWKFLLIGGKKGDARLVELKRLQAYNKGTRLLALLSVLMVLPAFFLPFTAPFIGFDAYLIVVAIYFLIMIAVGLASVALSAGLDAFLALRHERGTTFANASKELIGYSRAHAGEAAWYVATKFFIDIALTTLVVSLFMPALIALIGVLLYLIRAIPAGEPGMWSGALLRLLTVAALALAAALVSTMLSKPVLAFYGYYTEEAIRRMRGGQDG